MQLLYAPLFSGSSGNCVFVGTDRGGILVDAGVSGSRILTALEQIGVAPASLNGLLVTHEHNDHIKGVGILSRKLDLPVYATAGTWEAMRDKIGAIAGKNQRVIEAGDGFSTDTLDILSFRIPHDAADPVGFLFERNGARFAVATDIGCVRDAWLQPVLEADAVLLESNYDPDMLQAGPYPYELKKRILSRKGHLSNDDAGSAAIRLAKAGTRQIILGHLSKENNLPSLALRSVQTLLEMEGINPGTDLDLRTANRDQITGLFSLKAELRF